jgi:cytochrome c peroxidase
MSDARVELGRRLFHDQRLSGNETFSCASCHLQALAFTDGLARSIGATGEHHRRNSMPLANVGYARTVTWANTVLPGLEAQALVPMFGADPVELGLSGLEGVVLSRLEADVVYPALFHEAFPEEAEPLALPAIVKALAAFERTLVSGDSPYDRHRRGDASALSPSALRGLALFRSDRLRCSRCHSGLALSEAFPLPGEPIVASPFHNTGLYDLDGAGAYPAEDPGLMGLTGLAADMGRFRTPSLRNVAVTAPYMHDGSVPTLGDVIDHYAAGGRSALSNGNPSPLRDPLVTGFTLEPGEKEDLVAFLESLTDEAFLSDPRFASPF